MAVLRGIAAVLLAAAVLAAAEVPSTTIDTSLGRCRVRIVMPASWSRGVLIHAHGLRTEQMPLEPDMNVGSLVSRFALDSGWIVATTSYRRNGWIVKEAGQDIDQLLDFIVRRFGRPSRVFVDGASMGGAVAALMAESRTQRYSGFLAVGAALPLDSTNREFAYTCAPTAPLLFLSNQNELEGPRAYAAKAARTSRSRCAVWTVLRDGHCNVTEEEELAALKAVVAAARGAMLESRSDATIAGSKAASVAVLRGIGLYAPVTKTDPVYGNITTAFVADDLKRLGISQGMRMRVGFKGKWFDPLLATTSADVPQGEWVAFFDADGFLRIARNFASAQSMLGCREGDTLGLLQVPKAK